MAFQNINTCRSFQLSCNTNLVSLTSQPCSEVIIYNRTGNILEVYDQGYTASDNAFLLSAGDSFVVRGVTDSNQISAKCTSGDGIFCYRTQFFSNFSHSN
jgi:hypothetical protein